MQFQLFKPNFKKLNLLFQATIEYEICPHIRFTFYLPKIVLQILEFNYT